MMITAEKIARSLGKAQRSQSGWTCLCPAHDDHKPSLSVAEGDSGLILIHCHAGCTQMSVIAALQKRNLWPTFVEKTAHQNPSPTSKKTRNWAPILPIPIDAPSPDFESKIFEGLIQRWIYKDAIGQVLGYVLRFETPAGKSYRTLTFCENAKGMRSWRFVGFPKPRPLYGLHELADRADEPVVITEGEKAADALRAHLHTFVTVTWPNGANAVNHADWSPMAGRIVYIWPDADAPGFRAGSQVAEQCEKAGAAYIYFLQVPPKLG